MDPGMEGSVSLHGVMSLWYSGGHYILAHSNEVQKSQTAVIGVVVEGLDLGVWEEKREKAHRHRFPGGGKMERWKSIEG